MNESWKPVVGHEGRYEVSDHGRIRSVDRLDAIGRPRRGKVLRPFRVTSGHLRVELTDATGAVTSTGVHRLVLTAFVGPCPDGMQGCHGDSDPTNNHLSNLRWDTQSGNSRDAVENGSHSMTKRTHCPQGHEYTPQNTRINRRGARVCRACETERLQKKNEARRGVRSLVACDACGKSYRTDYIREHHARVHSQGEEQRND